MNNLDVYSQKQHINILRSRMKKEHIDFTGNILILSDRLVFLASELLLCIEEISDANMIGLVSDYTDMKEFMNCDIDYLIIVGYLKNEDNYIIIDKLRKKNENLKTIQWAIIDNIITYNSMKYKIRYQFDRMKPVNEFVNYLKDIWEESDSYDKDS